MNSIPNLNTLRHGRRGPRLRNGAHGLRDPNDARLDHDETASASTRDQIIQQTDHDANSSRLSAVRLGYLRDEFAELFGDQDKPSVRRYPIINRGTYIRTSAIDRIVERFLTRYSTARKQIVSLGAGSDTRFFRLISREDDRAVSGLVYHELDFEANVLAKRRIITSSPRLSSLVHEAESRQTFHHLHAIDLRDLGSSTTATSSGDSVNHADSTPSTLPPPPPPSSSSSTVIPHLDRSLPTLLLSECCLCYLTPNVSSNILTFFTTTLSSPTPLAICLYEPIRPADAFGKTMIANLSSRGISMPTVLKYPSLHSQRERLHDAGFVTGTGSRDVLQIWDSEQWTSEGERRRIERIEWLDEVEEWSLLARHYCVAWGWRGDELTTAFDGLNGERTKDEDGDDGR